MGRASDNKSRSMNPIIYLSIIVSLLVLAIPVSAQVNMDEIREAKVFSVPTDKNKEGIFKAQKIKGKISGMGAYQFKNGSLYYGDFLEKKFHGMGTLISPDSIFNCPDCAIFVGRFKQGLKNGKGRCYNSAGELIYEGKFKDDKPIDVYPNIDCKVGDAHYFSSLSDNDYCLFGEFIGDVPDGVSMLIFRNGDIYITQFNEGIQYGLGVYILIDGSWECWKNDKGESTFISSSGEYEALRKKAKDNFRNSLGVALNYFSEAAKAGAVMTSQIQNFGADNLPTSISDGTTESVSSSVNKGLSNGNKYSISEQQSYNRDKSTYHKYDGLLSKAFSGNSTASLSEIKEWKSKMKKLREKWESRGRDFPHLPNEDR